MKKTDQVKYSRIVFNTVIVVSVLVALTSGFKFV